MENNKTTTVINTFDLEQIFNLAPTSVLLDILKGEYDLTAIAEDELARRNQV